MLIDITQSEINAFFTLLKWQPSTSPELLMLAMKLREVASNPVTEGGHVEDNKVALSRHLIVPVWDM
jgi:hypothetical protein